MATQLEINQITALYEDILFREPDSGGLAFWSDQLDSGALTLTQIVNDFVNSAEAQEHVDPIVRLYLGLFGRTPDVPGLTGWVGALDSGTSLIVIVQDFLSTPEFFNDFGGDLGGGTTVSLSNATAFVTSLYSHILGRAPDAAGLANWVNILENGNGTAPTVQSEAAVVIGFVNSAEYVNDTENGIISWETAAALSALAGTTASAIGTATYPDTITNTAYTTDLTGATASLSVGTDGVIITIDTYGPGPHSGELTSSTATALVVDAVGPFVLDSSTMDDVSSITVSGSSQVVLGDLTDTAGAPEGSYFPNLKSITVMSGSGPVDVQISPAHTSFTATGASNEVVITSNPSTTATFWNGNTINGAGILYADYASSSTDIALGTDTSQITNSFTLGVVGRADGTYDAANFSALIVGIYSVYGDSPATDYYGVAGPITFTNVAQDTPLDIIDANSNSVTYTLMTPFATAGAMSVTIGQDIVAPAGDLIQETLGVATPTSGISTTLILTGDNIGTVNIDSQGTLANASAFNSLTVADADDKITSLVVTGDSDLILSEGEGTVTSVDTAGMTSTANVVGAPGLTTTGPSPIVNVDGVVPAAGGFTVTGGTFFIYADGEQATTAGTTVNVYNIGSAGGEIEVGGGGAGNQLSEDDPTTANTGSETINLAGVSGTTVILPQFPIKGDTTDGARVIINGWSSSTANTLVLGATDLNGTAVVAPVVIGDMTNVAGAHGEHYNIADGVFTLTGPDPSLTGQEEINDVQTILDSTAGVKDGYIAMVADAEGTYVMIYDGGGSKDTIVELAGVSETTLVSVDGTGQGDLVLGSAAAPIAQAGWTIMAAQYADGGGASVFASGTMDTINLGDVSASTDNVENDPVIVQAAGESDIISVAINAGPAGAVIGAAGTGDTLTLIGGTGSNPSAAIENGGTIEGVVAAAGTEGSAYDIAYDTLGGSSGAAALSAPPQGDTPVGANATVNIGDATGQNNTTGIVWLGENSTVNINDSGNTNTTADLWVTGDVTGATSSGAYAQETINWNAGTLNLYFFNATSEGWAGGNAADSAVNVSTATSLGNALDIAAGDVTTLNANFDSGNNIVSPASGPLELAAKTGLVDWFQYGGNTYLVEAINSGTAAATHTALGTGDVVVELVGLHNLDVTGGFHFA